MLVTRHGWIPKATCLIALAVAGLLAGGTLRAQAKSSQVSLELDPAQSKINWTLPASFHTVHGTFAFTKGSAEFDSVSGRVTGEISADARSGQSGDSGRDENMHKKVLESGKYPVIAFRPDRVEGKIDLQGSSKVQIHGIFELHGGKHESSIPAEVTFAGAHWTAKAAFDIPYVQWGMKNPSNFFLHVPDNVRMEIELSGRLVVAAGN